MNALKITALILLFAAPSTAQPLAQMAGNWRGSGWAKETLDGPQESIRCQIENTYEDRQGTLTVKGKCVVPGKRLTLSGELSGKDGTERITGRWFNPDGIGATRVTGIQRDSIVAFFFRATDPKTGQTLSQNVEWKLSGDRLRLRTTDRKNPDVQISDITFTR